MVMLQGTVMQGISCVFAVNALEKVVYKQRSNNRDASLMEIEVSIEPRKPALISVYPLFRRFRSKLIDQGFFWESNSCREVAVFCPLVRLFLYTTSYKKVRLLCLMLSRVMFDVKRTAQDEIKSVC